LATPEAKGAAERAGIEIRYLPPEALATLVQRESDYWSQTIKARGIKAD
jgi:tripartite-type tricarboxylate transporter receptor subunit TctC